MEPLQILCGFSRYKAEGFCYLNILTNPSMKEQSQAMLEPIF
jgi:hypothetical protein